MADQRSTEQNQINDIMTADEVARLLRVKTSWVRERARCGDIPCRYFGRYQRFIRSEIVEWIAGS